VTTSVKIPTANPAFSTMPNVIAMWSSDYDNDVSRNGKIGAQMCVLPFSVVDHFTIPRDSFF